MERSRLMAPARASDVAHYSEITEDMGAYLEPQPCSVAHLHAPYASIDDAHDLSMLEGSVCDTDYFDRMTSPNKSATIDVDKYKIKPPPPHSSAQAQNEAPFDERDVERCNGKVYRLYDRSKMAALEAEAEDEEIAALSEDSEDETLRVKRRPLSIDSDCLSAHALNDLGLDPRADDAAQLRDPNINMHAQNVHTPKTRDVTHASSSSSQNGSDDAFDDVAPVTSHDDAVERLRTALSRSNEGLVTLYEGNTTEVRLSDPTQRAINAHDMRVSSSDC